MPKFMKNIVKSMMSVFSSNSDELTEISENNESFGNSYLNRQRSNVNKCVGEKIVFDKKDDSKPPCAVIVTIKSGSSYDHLFTSTQQVSPDETVAVKVFHFNYASLPDILLAISGQPCRHANPQVTEVIHDMLECRKMIDADSFVVNFECCSACSCQGFEPSASEPVQKLLAWIIKEKHVAMFADFSLKSLIADWSETELGPNPFINLGETDRTLELQFDPEQLLESPNTQLQNLGRMCNKGKAYVNVMPSTIVFTVNRNNAQTKLYELEVLTVANSSGGRNVQLDKNGTTGSVGHAILRYDTGAIILVSAGHWIELNHLEGVDEESLIQTTERTMGLTEAIDLRRELDGATTFSSKNEVLQRRAKRTLLSSAPCKYSGI